MHFPFQCRDGLPKATPRDATGQAPSSPAGLITRVPVIEQCLRDAQPQNRRTGVPLRHPDGMCDDELRDPTGIAESARTNLRDRRAAWLNQSR